jgi:outer membrane protein TolC
MKWDWDFGIKKARIDKKRAEYRRLSFTKENAEMGIPIQIAELYHELKEWQKAAESYHQAAISARKWVVSAMSEFDMGVGTAENLLFGIEKYGDNQGRYLESLYNYHITMAKLEAAIGKGE